MLRVEDLRKADLATGLLLCAVGIASAAVGLRMPRPEAAGAITAFLVSPGAMPILLGTTLTVGGLAILRRGYRESGLPGLKDVYRLRRAAGSPVAKRTLTVIGTFTLFVLVLIGRLPFWLATFTYLAVLMTLLRAARFRVILGVSFLVAIGLHLLFGVVMQLPLP